ncbi:hypothetical protein C0991_006623 [Blastosporella zonata]|nr:hypothetical protein C0991_006623 [Blastosporella zonata]
MPATDAVLTQILAQLDAMQIQQQTMQAKLDAISSANKAHVVPLEPTHGRSTSTDHILSSSPIPISTVKASLASAEPHVGTPPLRASDREREKLLYPGRVNLTSKHVIAPRYDPPDRRAPCSLS